MPKVVGKLERAIGKVLVRTWSPNQIVAHNLTRARLLRGWTQEEAAERLAPFLGTRLSLASFSAIERSIRGTRVKQFSADELVALSRAFDLPIGWWFTPPDEGALHTPDHQRTGIDFAELVDLTLGTPDTLPPWRQALEDWASHHAPTTTPPGSSKGPAARAGNNLEIRAQSLIRQRFGSLTAARDTLQRLVDLLDDLDQPTAGSTDRQAAPPTRSRRTAPATTPKSEQARRATAKRAR